MRGVPASPPTLTPIPGFRSSRPIPAEVTRSARRRHQRRRPTWAGIIALADQYAGRHLGSVNPAIYQIAHSSHYHQAFHDITAGPANTAKFPP